MTGYWRHCILLILLLAGNVFPQIKIHENFGSEDGLVQSHIFRLAEDKDGYIWIGTYDGASRWDGLIFENFHPHDGLVSPVILDVHIGLDGAVYLATDAGVSVYRKGQFSTIDVDCGLSENYVTAVIQARDSTLYFGTQSCGVCIFRGSQIATLDIEDGLPDNSIRDIWQCHDGSILVGTNRGVVNYRNGNVEGIPELNGIPINCIYESSDSTLYFGTASSGIKKLHRGNWSVLNTQMGLPSDHIRDICESQDGRLFIATFGGGVYIKNDKIEIITDKNGLAHNSVFCLLPTLDNVVLFGTVGGLSLYRPSRIEVYNEDTGLTKNYVTALCQADDGAYYIGTYGGGVYVLKGDQSLTLSRKDGLADDHIYDIAIIDGTIFFATGDGLSIYKNGKFTKTLNVNDGINASTVRTLAKCPDGGLVIGTDNGINFYRNQKIEKAASDDGSSEETVYDLYPAEDGSILIGTENGLYSYKNNRFTPKAAFKGLTVNSIFRSSRGILYIGTSQGLYYKIDEEWNKIDVEAGLSHNTIMGISEDHSGKIYLSTFRGVNILDFSLTPAGIRTLRYSDGLSCDECTHNTCLRDRDGIMWFGTIRGITKYNPHFDKPNLHPPRVRINDLELNGRPISIDTVQLPLDLKHNQNYIKLNFVGIDLSAPTKVQYLIRMKGLDRDWMLTDQNTIYYANLDDGKYAFEVKAKNDWNVWSKPATFAFTIEPPFWERWWFISGTVLLVAGILTRWITLRIKAMLAVERLKTKLAADLHDNIGAGLTEITILTEVANKQIENQEFNGAKYSLCKVGEAARILVDMMSDIVWLVNPKQDSLHDMILRLRDTYAEITSAANIRFKTNNLDVLSKIHLPMEYRQHLYLLFKEAINNSLKHSKSTEIALEAKLVGRQLKMSLIDNGKGFYADQVGSGNGLSNMRNRAKSIGGELLVEAIPKKGTRVEFKGRVK